VLWFSLEGARGMTAQAIELKRKERSDIHFQWARKELETNKERYSRKKMDVICGLASKLEEEGEIETNKISTEIAKRLKQYVTQRYVNEVLDGRYKNKKYVESAKSRRTNSAKTKRAAQTVEADIIREYELPQDQTAAAKRSVEYNKLDALILENSELKVAVKRQTMLLSADQVSANEIMFIVPKEKFNQLMEAMKVSRDSIRLIFDKSGVLECAESDIFEQQQLTKG
jgi:hypothetical protein